MIDVNKENKYINNLEYYNKNIYDKQQGRKASIYFEKNLNYKIMVKID